MNSPSFFRPHDADAVRDTNLLDLIQIICLTLSRRLRRQRVSYSIDVDRDLRFPLAAHRVGDVVEQMVADSLRAMPGGGQLDLTAVVGVRGLEIEVADSGVGFEPDEMPRLFQPEGSETGTEQGGQWPSGMQVQMLGCPQGGTARTLFIPWPALKAAA